MRGGEATASLQKEPQHLAPLARRLAEPLSERRALHELHHQVDVALGEAGIEDRHQVRVHHLRHRLCFAEQPGLRVGAARIEQALDGDEALELRVPASQDAPHAAAAELVEHHVAADVAARGGVGLDAREHLGARVAVEQVLRERERFFPGQLAASERAQPGFVSVWRGAHAARLPHSLSGAEEKLERPRRVSLGGR